MKLSRKNFKLMESLITNPNIANIVRKAKRKHKFDKVFYSTMTLLAFFGLIKLYNQFMSGLLADPNAFAKYVASWQFKAQIVGFILILAYGVVTLIVACETIVSTPLNELTNREIEIIRNHAANLNFEISDKNTFGFYEIKKRA